MIHQPRYSIFTGCDDVLFLGKGGRTAYLGPTKFAATYFDQLGFHPPPNDNPADFCIDVLSGSVPREGDLNFKPADLFDMWTNDGPAQVDAFFAEYSEQHSGLADTTPTPYQPYTRRTTEIMPRDVECMGNIFRDIDIDGDGAPTPRCRAFGSAFPNCSVRYFLVRALIPRCAFSRSTQAWFPRRKFWTTSRNWGSK